MTARVTVFKKSMVISVTTDVPHHIGIYAKTLSVTETVPYKVSSLLYIDIQSGSQKVTILNNTANGHINNSCRMITICMENGCTQIQPPNAI
jgi:hypothetical protein